ncbi:uncharacterized protein Z520_07773 [Fonsecaea multimorphosa CBS 102226]|uniref:Uncharacterized protein n=1 Tax=Fonsecaea multimorphosa CBS 102226 TaxID=1442371 RepID=A0A0D2JSR7_9EURO|nr:uncharacterized protein Z520_07773 [Fonsecaea multimorphosa CBS 102226]KIX96507.1 hypothetical protein Z520_07773 [Fonsecaea multimorphosa CBS 102226]
MTPLTLVMLADQALTHSVALYFHYDQLSKAAGTFSNEVRQLHKRSTRVSLSLCIFGELLRGDGARVLDTNNLKSKNVQEVVDEASTALFEAAHDIQRLKIAHNTRETQETTITKVWDGLKSYVGYTLSPAEKEQAMIAILSSKLDDAEYDLANLNHIVTATIARMVSELLDRERQPSPTKLFRAFWTRKQRVPPALSSVVNLSRREAKAWVETLCAKDETYRCFLGDTKVVVLLGEISDVNEIVAFLLWNVGQHPELYKLDKTRQLLTYPRGSRKDVTVLVSEAPQDGCDRVSLRFLNREGKSHDSDSVLFLEIGITVLQMPSQGQHHIKYIAEVLELHPDWYRRRDRILFLWPDQGPGFMFQDPGNVSYKAGDYSVSFYGAKMTVMKDGMGHRRRQSLRYSNYDDRRGGDFKIRFGTSDHAAKVYSLLRSSTTADN